VVVQRAAVALERQEVIGFGFAYRLGHICRAAIRVGGDDGALDVDELEQRRDSLNLTRRTFDRTVCEQHLLFGRPHVQKMQRSGLRGPLQRTAQSLAVDRDNLAFKAPCKSGQPSAKSPFELCRVKSAEYPAERVRARRAVGHFEKRLEPFLSLLRELLEIVPPVSTTDCTA